MKTETAKKLDKLPEDKKRFINAFWDAHVILEEAKRRLEIKNKNKSYG